MTFRLAYGPIAISHNGNVVRLRPSLRAGLLIAERYSLTEIGAAFAECNLGVMSYMLDIGAEDADAALTLITQILTEQGWTGLQSLVPALTTFISASMGLSETAEDVDGDQSEFARHVDYVTEFTSLFEFATGWLCWTPAEAWAATPTEIIVARRGHYAMLKAIHGGDDTPAAHDPEALPSENDVKHGVSQIRSKLSAVS